MEKCDKKIIYLYWSSECETYLEAAGKWLLDTFSGIMVKKASMIQLDDRHYDRSRYQYDAVELLEEFPQRAISVYLLHCDLYHPGYRYLYGASLPGMAVVSDFRPDTEEGFLKEVCHETGHALGLRHCPHDCVMHPSRSEKALEAKSKTLCTECKRKLKKLMKNI